VATPPAGTVEGQQRSPQVTWLLMGRLHGGEAGSGARHDLEGRSEVARADEPGLTKYLNATELGADPRAIRSRPILRVRPSAMKGTLLEA
jgi:hypothetical protein